MEGEKSAGRLSHHLPNTAAARFASFFPVHKQLLECYKRLCLGQFGLDWTEIVHLLHTISKSFPIQGNMTYLKWSLHAHSIP